MNPRDALVLFAHGARDARSALPLERLRLELERMRPGTPVRTAFLEIQSPSLPQVLAELAAADCRSVGIVPIFWSQGGHVAVDLPALVQEFVAREPGVRVRVLPALSELPGMHDFVAGAILAQLGASTAAPGEGAA